jgi:CubicO group peptidase (beta-lactamase class C family)
VTLPLDATGTPVGSRAMLASARDWARFGMLYLNDGVVGGRRILPEGWVQYSSAPTPGARLGYGAGFWTNLGPSPGASFRRSNWGMPADSFYASGWLGQIIVIVPFEQLVVARFGVSHASLADHDDVARLVTDVLAATKK